MRKRIYSTAIALLSCATILAQPVSAKIPDIDMDNMSAEELVELRDTINEKIAENGGDNMIGAGLYETGIDIKSGLYKLTVNDNDGSSLWIKIFNNKDDYNSYQKGEGANYISSMILSKAYSENEENESTSLQLLDGQVLLIEQGSAVIQEIKSSWMPDKGAKTDKKEKLKK